MKILIENYRAKCPLDPSSKVNLCEEEAVIYDSEIKREIKIRKLFLITVPGGIRFSNQDVEEENKDRIKEARIKKKKNL